MQRRNKGHGNLVVGLNHTGELIQVVGCGVGIVLCFPENADCGFSHLPGIPEPLHDLLNRIDFRLRDGTVGLSHFGQTAEEGHLKCLCGCADAIGTFIKLMPEANADHGSQRSKQGAEDSADNFSCPSHILNPVFYFKAGWKPAVRIAAILAAMSERAGILA